MTLCWSELTDRNDSNSNLSKDNVGGWKRPVYDRDALGAVVKLSMFLHVIVIYIQLVYGLWKTSCFQNSITFFFILHSSFPKCATTSRPGTESVKLKRLSTTQSVQFTCPLLAKSSTVRERSSLSARPKSHRAHSLLLFTTMLLLFRSRWATGT